MRPDLILDTKSTTTEPGLVSGRFLSDLFSSLERHNIPATQMLGDLPISIDEVGRVTQAVEWADFAAFMKRLEHHMGGPEGLEICGERIGELKPSKTLRSLVGFSASPYSLYRAASLWALRRAMPAVETRIEEIEPNRIEIRVRIRDGLRPCPQLFHLAIGSARALPRILGLCDAVVVAEVGHYEAVYQIAVPPSRTLWARIARIARTLFSAGSVLQFLEAQQLELHAKHDALQKTHAALAESERRYRAITDTAVDVLCEINERGQIEYVSASIEELMGYSPEQVTGSHFSLWVPANFREQAKTRLAAFAAQPIEQAITGERIRLHTESGEQIVAELSLRSYRTPEGELRMVGILRDQAHCAEYRPERRPETDRGPRRQRDALARLRSAVERLPHSKPENPIQKSLAVLLAALDQIPSDLSSRSDDRMVAATARMTQIVQSAMVDPPDGAATFRWLETKKLLDRVQCEFLAGGPIEDLDLEIDLSDAPASVWGEETLLAAGLGSLLDWAAQRAPGGAEIALRVAASRQRVREDSAIAFSVQVSPIPEEPAAQPRSSRSPRADDQDSELTLALAEDAVTALGGILILPDEGSRRPVGEIRLIQPTRGA